MQRSIKLRVNNNEYQRTVDVRLLLSDFLRHSLGLTGTHVGCEHGVCGSCTILLNGESVRSCLMFAVQADGAEILTVEGLAVKGELNGLQKAMWEHHALQCGFCTPGLLMTGEEMLHQCKHATDGEIRECISGHLCRCTGYQNIVEAFQDAVAKAAPASGSGD